jgi:hypothetical protein
VKRSLPRRADEGFRRSRGRARGVDWLQKSTSGARPSRFTACGSSLSSTLHRESERRNSVEFVDGRHPGSGKRPSLTTRHAEADLARDARRRKGRKLSRPTFGGRDRGCQRLHRQPGQRTTTPRPGGHRRRACRSQCPPGPSGASSPATLRGSGPDLGVVTMDDAG